jgi:hypothetical protein
MDFLDLIRRAGVFKSLEAKLVPDSCRPYPTGQARNSRQRARHTPGGAGVAHRDQYRMGWLALGSRMLLLVAQNLANLMLC